MKYNTELEKAEISVYIEELNKGQEDQIVNMTVEEFGSTKINLSDSDVNDLKEFYDKVFDYIIYKEKLIEFRLENKENGLLFEVAEEIIDHLNSEIKQSEDNFVKLIELKQSEDNFRKPIELKEAAEIL